MKKLTSILLFFSILLLSGCGNKTVTNHYSIGCLTFKGNLVYSDWEGFEAYISSLVDYNQTLTFTSESKEENDEKAVAYFNEQAAKLDTDSLCTFIAPGDYIVYGVGYSVSENSFYILKGLTFSCDTVTEYDEQFALTN
ncbi:MAG: hypothetical protein J6T59_02270 [Bacteroidales bacterium]|nr:hypothetical protein [Bacteroidales bacterium]MBO7646493.1 hypothetical protein [Bacteroidales bacterium]